jgi:predicted outer membrane protein
MSNRIDKRIGGHRANLVMGVHSNRKLQDIWNRNTPRDFAIEVLEEAPKGLDALSLQNWLGEREVFWIAQERSHGTSLNVEDGGFVETKASDKGYNEYVKEFDAAVRIEKRKIREQLKVAREHQSNLRQSLIKVERDLESKRQAYKRARGGWFDRLMGHHTIEARRCKEVLDAFEAEHEAVRLEFQGAAQEGYRLEESHRKHKTIKQLDNAFRRATRLY